MATLSRFPTLLDLVKAQDPNGKVAKVVELLAQTNPILQDLVYKEGNLQTGHQHSIRTGLPQAFWGMAYKGIPISKSSRATVTDTTGYLQARSEVDKKLATLNGNSAEFRLDEAAAFIEAMNQEMVTTIFYGNTEATPERFMGLAPRYNDKTTALSKRNIVDLGGTGSTNTSMWLVVHGNNTVHAIYPKGSVLGLDHQDLGEIDAFDSIGNRYRALAEMYQWDMGLTVRDWRYVVRMANIDSAVLADAGLSTGGTQALTAATNLVRATIKAIRLIPHAGMGKAVFYANREVVTALHYLALEKASPSVAFYESAATQFGDINGELRLFNIPVRQVDAILNTEARVV